MFFLCGAGLGATSIAGAVFSSGPTRSNRQLKANIISQSIVTRGGRLARREGVAGSGVHLWHHKETSPGQSFQYKLKLSSVIFKLVAVGGTPGKVAWCREGLTKVH